MKKNILLIHIPKTGGTSLKSALSKTCNLHSFKHKPTWEIKKEHKQVYSSSYKIVFVRNTWDRFVSIYYYYRDKNGTFIPTNMGFNEFVIKMLSEKPLHKLSDYFSNCDKNKQKNWVVKNEEVMVDFVGNYSSLQSDFDKLSEKLGLPIIQLPHKRKRTHPDYKELYTEETKDLVKQVFKEDIDYFNFKY